MQSTVYYHTDTKPQVPSTNTQYLSSGPKIVKSHRMADVSDLKNRNDDIIFLEIISERK